MSFKVNDMAYAYSANNAIKEKGEYGGVVTTIMKYLLEESIVDGVLAVEEGWDLYDAVPTIITDSKDLIKSAGSLHCGTLNLAKILVKYLNGARDMKLAISCKPCDAMAIRELIRKRKIIEDNIILIGVNCGGTMPPIDTIKMIKNVYKMDPNRIVKEEIVKGNLVMTSDEGIEKGIKIDYLEEENLGGRRENCRRCNLKIPLNADLALGNWGVIGDIKGKATFIEICSKKGADIFNKVVDAGFVISQEPSKKGIEIRSKIVNTMLKQSSKQKEKDFKGTTGDILDVLKIYKEELSKCMKCYGCREACPLCYCEDCCLETEGPEWVPGGYTPAAPFFHLTRMVHMADACINCGQCSEVCPSEIPVSKIWATVNEKIRETFQYYSGINNGDIPLPFSEYEDSGSRTIKDKSK
ncbi:Coenzyme F420 hydrogenase/dehydrogenase, beta subunit C-terminal domain [uncultured Methanobrevibacter sp.]|uniref:Coenzyme F420 hydrogenase/dehydrogenase, beta subunit C-terminal domain n=1 Tax=uncultured Methanobrevibacter sp. TaxID=253161 RepID=UPI0025FAAE80|nr:Coenzyme F420 hydrogenase/dehydrogenase, beta subunit C-terminal domain [uncultured Methanobrevibacter sp.]